jgi:tetratricopeptide (TPR) repeat protein
MWTPILALALAAQISAIQGEVRDAQSHNVIPFARVTLSSARTTVDWRYADQNGRFYFAGLPDATYYVLSVDHPSYNSVELDGSSLLAALPALIRMELVPREKRISGSAVSASELSIPKNARKELDRARNYVQHGRFDEAEKCYLKAASLSDAPEISVNFADLYSSQQRYQEAETLLVEAIRRHSNAGDLYHALATIYFAQGREDDAAELAQQAHARKHSIADVHLLLAKIQLSRQNFKGVAGELEIYLREAPFGPNSDRIRQDLAKYRNKS